MNGVMNMWSKEEIAERMVTYRTPHYAKEFPIILFWSQKSGCTSLVKWFFDQIGLLDKAISYNPWVHHYEFEIYNQNEVLMKELREHLYQHKKKGYKLVRDPYKRAVSAFLMMLGENTFWHTILGDVREHLYGDRESRKRLAFTDFLRYVKETGPGVTLIDGHFAQQYIEGEERFVNKYIYLERFMEQLAELEEVYGLKKTDPRNFSESPHHFAPAMIHKGDYAEADIFDPLFPKLPTYDSFYNKETRQLVREIYAKDFEMYGYDRNDPAAGLDIRDGRLYPPIEPGLGGQVH